MLPHFKKERLMGMNPTCLRIMRQVKIKQPTITRLCTVSGRRPRAIGSDFSLFCGKLIFSYNHKTSRQKTDGSTSLTTCTGTSQITIQ
jgi:hypothetical protein